MDERPPEGQEEEEADEHHRDEMRQAFVLNPGNLFVVIRQQLGERFLCRPAGQQLPRGAFVPSHVVDHKSFLLFFAMQPIFGKNIGVFFL
jgi:hypothetical protein